MNTNNTNHTANKAELANKINTIRNMTSNHPQYETLRAEIKVLQTLVNRYEQAEQNKAAWDKVS